MTLAPGYQGCWVTANEAKNERWLLIHSEQGAKQQTRTLLKQFEKALKQATSEAKKLSAIPFICEADALQAADRFSKSLKYHTISQTITPVYRHQKQGRPKRGEAAQLMHYQLVIEVEKSQAKCRPYENQLGRFILGTNETKNILTAELMNAPTKKSKTLSEVFVLSKSLAFS